MSVRNAAVSQTLVCAMWMVALASASQAAEQKVPEALVAPAGDVLTLRLMARGAQIYQCQGTEWKFQGPEAQLTDSSGHVVGKHYAGPTWEFSDGSTVVGEVLAHDDGPDSTAVAWLLLRAKSTTGHGKLSDVHSIQRLQTTGGKAPVAACGPANANQVVRVPYTANYYFYVAGK
jgi:hypothetical protein